MGPSKNEGIREAVTPKCEDHQRPVSFKVQSGVGRDTPQCRAFPVMCPGGPAGMVAADGCDDTIHSVVPTGRNDILCNFNGKSLKFVFTRAIQPPLLISIEYTFSSGTPSEAMVEYVSSQYPHVAGPDPFPLNRRCSGCFRWWLTDELVLTLVPTIAGPGPYQAMPGTGGPWYDLALGSANLQERENQIIKQQQLNVNPRPKF
jgi:hypothetical protein